MRPRTFVDALRDRASSARADNGYTFLKDGEGEGERLSYAELDRRARALAALLQERGAAGERTLLLLPAGLDFITSLFGCFYAGALAVPLPPPDPLKAGPAQLELVARNSRARFALSLGDTPQAPGALDGLQWIDVATIDKAAADSWRPQPIDETAPALIQYTSGSMSEPKGVVIRHSNLIANAMAIADVFGISQDSRGVSWLPPHHDMGLMGGILEPLLLGAETALMPPQAFLQRPLRWLAAITRFRATTCGGPGFAYDLLARRVPEAAKAELDLSSWSVAFCGAEAVRADVLDSFARAFAPCGFRREAFLPCYGLAEATLMVTGERAATRATVLDLDPKALEQGRFEPAASDAPGRPIVGCGRPASGVLVRIVDPESREPRPAGHVGEVWVKGDGVAAGYWNEDEETRRSFDARLGNGEGPYLRTGDLGFLHNGELFPTGRLKDLIIVRGRNLYPQDLEATLERAHPAVRPGRAAAFSVTSGGEERLVVACEINRRIKAAPSEVADALERSIALEHGARPHAVVLLEPGALPRTSSGKPRRPICRALFEQGRLGGDQEREGAGGS